MNDESSTERSRNIWAPWRMEYIDALSEPDGGCFLCRYQPDKAEDEKHLVLWRGKHGMAVLNRFPYTGGHSMVAPYAHVGDLSQLDEPTMLELFAMLRDLQAALAKAVGAQGFNIGINIGRCAGAGLPGHLHIHIVPRWSGDTNFMAVFGGARVIPISLETMYAQLRQATVDLKLPWLNP
ncbi:MAG: HIT domain-containing protein [Phycisphaerae bacterium]|jgi:ATP adenylyltransferase